MTKSKNPTAIDNITTQLINKNITIVPSTLYIQQSVQNFSQLDKGVGINFIPSKYTHIGMLHVALDLRI